MDASDLRIFEAVARLGGINRAAADLHTVQSNVTTRLRLLEQELGVRLFDRSRRGVTLTAAGQRLLPYALKVRDEIDNARRAVVDDGVPRGPMTIGSLETTTAVRLSPMLASYVAAYPEVDVTLRAGTTDELIEAVLRRGLEGAFVCGPVDHPELIEETVFSRGTGADGGACVARPRRPAAPAEPADRRVAGRMRLPPAPRGHPRPARRGRAASSGVRHARSRVRLRRRGARNFPVAEGADRFGLAVGAGLDPCAAARRGDGRDRLHPSPRQLSVERAGGFSARRSPTRASEAAE